MSRKQVTKRQKLDNLVAQLDKEFQSFQPVLQDCNDYILPTRGRFFIDDVNKGTRKNDKIIDSTATNCANVGAAGLQSGITSPARIWFELKTQIRSLNRNAAVKRWLSDVAQIMSDTFLQTNLYKVLPMCYKDLLVFGTSPIYVEADDEKVLKFKSFPAGSYRVAQNSDGKVNVFVRKFRYTVQQVVETFCVINGEGEVESFDNVSDVVKQAWINGQTQDWVDIIHVIQPNYNYDPELRDWNSKYKKFYSCYYETGNYKSGANDKVAKDDIFLRESGYDYFPVLCPRWLVTGEDVYAASCPGIDSLGDIKQLQVGEMRSLEAIDKLVNPPTTGPSEFQGKSSTGKIMPGEHIVSNSRNAQEGIRPIYQVNFSIRELEEKQDQVRGRIEENFFKNLFLAFAKADRKSGTTAEEIVAIKDEKLLALGPSYEQLNQDLLDPLIDIAFYEHLVQGIIPPPPPELRGQKLKVEYISLMSQAQKMIGISAIERTTAFVGQMAQFDPNAIDKLNVDYIIDLYAESTGVNPSAIRSDDEVVMIRKQKAQALQQQQNAELLIKGSEAAKNLSESYVEGDSALARMLGQ